MRTFLLMLFHDASVDIQMEIPFSFLPFFLDKFNFLFDVIFVRAQMIEYSPRWHLLKEVVANGPDIPDTDSFS